MFKAVRLFAIRAAEKASHAWILYRKDWKHMGETHEQQKRVLLVLVPETQALAGESINLQGVKEPRSNPRKKLFISIRDSYLSQLVLK